MKGRIISLIAEIKIRLDRGNSLLYWFRNLIIMTAGIQFIFGLGLKATMFIGVVLIISLYLLGWLDLDLIKLFQEEAEIRDGKYNPYFKRKLG